jgi:hypothetical protein
MILLLPAETTFLMRSPTVSADRKIYKRLKSRKQQVSIKYRVIFKKCRIEIVTSSLTKTFDKTIRTKSIFPKDWRLARVNPILKKAKKEDMNNYRSISVISGITKN